MRKCEWSIINDMYEQLKYMILIIDCMNMSNVIMCVLVTVVLSIELSVMFRHIYLIGFHVLVHISDKVSRSNALGIWVYVPQEERLSFIHS